MKRSVAGHEGPTLFDELLAQGAIQPVETRPAPLVGAEGLRADAQPLALGYAGKDRNAAPRVEALGYWAPDSAKSTVTFADTSSIASTGPESDTVVAALTNEEASVADGSEVLQGDARTARVAAIRQGLADIGIKETVTSTRAHVAHRNYLDMYSR